MFGSPARRLAIAGLLGSTLLLPGAALADSPSPAGTLTGTITCGADEVTPAAHALVGIQGLPTDVVQTDAAGHFTLVAPAAEALTLTAASDPQDTFVASRYHVTVQPGQTLDVGSLDLGICPQPAAPAAAPQEQSITPNGPADTSPGQLF